MSSKTLEIEEKTIDGAIEKACRDFGVPREKLNIEIISEGSGGFLGLMAKKAKIRASLLSFDMDFSLDNATRSVSSRNRQEEKPALKADVKPDRKPDIKTEIKQEAKQEKRHHAKPDIRQQSEHRKIRPTPAASKAPVHRPEALETTPEASSAPHESSPALRIPKVEALPATTPAALKAGELLAGMLSKMTFECWVTATETDDTIILSIAGDDSGLLIGRRGQNLDALQYILNKAVNKSDTERKMIVVDSEEYRKRREESLLGMAERIREKVKKTQKPLSLSHMNAHDRRIIHLALQEDETLITRSRGEGEYRKVIVLPARKTSSGGSGKTRNRQ
jgi:spoIIIJ-associated protein